MVKPMLAKIADASGLTPMGAWASISIQTIIFLVCEAMLCPEQRVENASAVTAPKCRDFIAWLTSTATGERNQETGHGRDIFFCRTLMALPRSAEITTLLRAWSNGDHAALERIAALVYDELHRMARHYMQDERKANTLQTTAL